MARRLVMLLAIMSCVSASRCVDARGGLLGASVPSSAIHCSSQHERREGAARQRSCCRKRETKTGVSGGRAVDELRAAHRRAPRELASLARRGCAPPTRRLRSISSSRCTVRSAMRRTLSIRPSRSIAGTAQSSPMRERRDLAGRRRTNELDVVEVDATLGVRDQRDRQLVDARIAGERPVASSGSSR